MEASHGALAACGLILGWWSFSGPNREIKADPPTCHCVCNIKPEQRDHPEGTNWSTLLGVWLLVFLLGINLAVAFTITVRKREGGEQEYTNSFKGRQGKGVYGAARGLQIVDH